MPGRQVCLSLALAVLIEMKRGMNALDALLKRHGEHLVVEPQTLIVSRGGEFPGSIYFILEGKAAGVREYADGNEYSYFCLDRQNGSIGLLEMFARKESYIATIVSIT